MTLGRSVCGRWLSKRTSDGYSGHEGESREGDTGSHGGGGEGAAGGLPERNILCPSLPGTPKPHAEERWVPCDAPPNPRFSKEDAAKLFAGIKQVRELSLSLLSVLLPAGAPAGLHLPGVVALGCAGQRSGRTGAPNRCYARASEGDQGNRVLLPLRLVQCKRTCGAVLAELPRLTLSVALYRPLAGCQATAHRPARLRLRHRPSLPPAQAGAGSQVDPGRVLRRSPRVLIPLRLPSAAVGGGIPWCWMNCGTRSPAPPGLPWLAAWWRRPWPCAGPVTGRRGARRPGHDRSSKRPWRPWTRRRSASVSR